MIARILLGIVLLILLIGGVALLLVVLLHSFTPLTRSTATASSGSVWDVIGYAEWDRGRLSVWVYTPEVAPGDPLSLEVYVYGGLRIAVDEIDGTLGQVPFHERGPGAKWGTRFTHKQSSSMAEASQMLALHVPPDARPGDVLDLRLKVRHTLAASSGGGFQDRQATTELTVPIPVRSRVEAVLWRCLSAGRALLAFVLLYWLIRWLARHPSWFEFNIDPNFLYLPGVIIVIAHCWLGYLLFASPLLAALGMAPGWFLGPLLVGVWLLGPPLLLARFPAPPVIEKDEPDDKEESDRKAGGGAFRLPAGWKVVARVVRTYELAPAEDCTPGAAVAVSEVRAALAGRPEFTLADGPDGVLELTATQGHPGYVQGPEPGTAVWSEGKGRLTLRFADASQVRPEQIGISSDDPMLTAACCQALHPLFGGLRVRLQGVAAWVAVSPTSDSWGVELVLQGLGRPG
jgi:hypothetical protein